MKDVIIIGAGIAGLSAGFELSKNNMDFQILETSSRVGGNIESLNTAEYLTECGPHTFSSNSKETLELIKELEIEELLIEASKQSKKRYVYKNNQLLPIPHGLKDFFNTDLLSKDAKFTILEEFFIQREEKEESIEGFIGRRFGREVLKNLVQPFLNGLFGGDVQKLSANAVFPKLKELEKNYKSIFWGTILSGNFKKIFKNLTLYSFKHGMETLPLAIYDKIKNKVTLDVKEITISKAKDFYIVTFKSNNKIINYTTNSILFAIPAYSLSNYSYIFPREYLIDLLQFDYCPIAVVNQVVDKSKIKLFPDGNPDGFGFLCTKEPHRKLLGSLFSSTIFPERSPQDKALITSYLGGAHFKKIQDMNEEEIKSLATKETSEIFQVTNQSEIETLNVKLYKNAIPQYNLGHLEKIKRIEGFMNNNSGLFFTGNYLYGISINDTVKTSKKVVDKVMDFVKLIKVDKKEALATK